jgi:hypothetical protein
VEIATMQKKKKKAKPLPHIYRPWMGSTIRVLVEDGAPQPRWMQSMIVKQRKGD